MTEKKRGVYLVSPSLFILHIANFGPSALYIEKLYFHVCLFLWSELKVFNITLIKQALNFVQDIQYINCGHNGMVFILRTSPQSRLHKEHFQG